MSEATVKKRNEHRPGRVRGKQVPESPANAPGLAFSPDGTKLAGTVKQPSGESIVIWTAPR